MKEKKRLVSLKLQYSAKKFKDKGKWRNISEVCAEGQWTQGPYYWMKFLLLM